MPVHNHPAQTAATKPLTPALSAHLKNRPGLAPRLATKGSATIYRAPTASPEREGTDVSFDLGDNITPRSEARRSRIYIDSPSTLDLAAASSESAVASSDRSAPLLSSTVASPSPSALGRVRSGDIPLAPPPARRSSGGSATVSTPRDDRKFFHANDLNIAISATNTGAGVKNRPRSVIQSPQISPRRLLDTSSKPEDKFFYANDVVPSPQQISARPLLVMRAAVSSILPTSKISTNHDLNNSSRVPLRSNTSVIEPDSATLEQTSLKDRRRSSSLQIQTAIVNTAKTKVHRKSLSATSTTIGAITNVLASTIQDISPVLSTSPPRTEGGMIVKQATQAPEAKAAGHPVGNMINSGSSRPCLPRMHTRGMSQSGLSQSEQDAANNARRERKVLDLEISNSSLLAINRTLEKELRKQNSELRRFRRLSRSGRISLNPAARLVSDHSLSTLDTLDELECELASSDSDHDTSSDEAFSESNSSAMNSIDMVRRRARDEKKLLEDLSHHRQLLIDSQKLTQSIQRCLNATDELIRDGNRAIDYQVGIGDVKLGGRVLQHEEDEEMSEVDTDELPGRQGLLSPSVDRAQIEQAAFRVNDELGGQKQAKPPDSPAREEAERLSPISRPVRV